MPRSQKKDYSQGPIWDEGLKRWLAEVVYPDDARGRRRFRRQRDAQIWWAAQQKAIEDGSWEAIAKPNRISVADAIARYREHSRVHHRSFSTYVGNGLAVLEETLGPDSVLNDITTANIEQMKLKRLESDNVAKSTVDKNVAVAKSFFSWCIHQGLTKVNPVKNVKLFHEDNERVRFLDPEVEYPKLLEQARNGPWYLQPIIVLDVNTGLRRGNILHLRWDQVDFKRRIIRIDSRTKSGRPHNLPSTTQPYSSSRPSIRRLARTDTSLFTWTERSRDSPSPTSRMRSMERSTGRRFRISDSTTCVTLFVRGLPSAASLSLPSRNSPDMRLSR